MPEHLVSIKFDTLVMLVKSHHKLEALEMGGVDNWDWYSSSLKTDYGNGAFCDMSDDDFENLAAHYAE